MKKFNSSLVLFLILGVFTLNSFAATYYVDSKYGSDSNNGTSTSTPWKSISKVNSKTYAAGDKILFKRGLTYIGSLTIKGSGTSSAPILFSNYGTGSIPVIDVNNASSIGISIYNNSYIVIDGFRITNFNNVTSGGGVRVIYAKYVKVLNNEIHVTGRAGVFVEGSNNTLVKNNKITTPNYAYPVQTDGIYAQRNNYSVFDGNHIVTSNLDPVPHVDAIQMYSENSATIKNNYVEVESTCPKYQGIYADHCKGTFEVYNNVAVGMSQTSSLLKVKNSGVGTATFKVIGNTIYGGKHGLFHTDDPNIIFKNNIVVTTGAIYPVYFQTDVTNKSNVSNNVYKRSGTGVIVYYVTSTSSKSLSMSQWKALGYDKNSLETDPVFTSITSRNFTLQSNSSAINKGYTFSSPYNVDKNGTVRPSGSFDIGAFENQVALAIEPKDESVELKKNNGNNGMPSEFELAQNYPNPFNPATTIKYALPKEMMVSLKVYNILGKEVATLVNEQKSAGYYEVNFNAANLASGTYIYRLETGNIVDVKKMILMK